MKTQLLQYLEPSQVDKIIDYTNNQLTFDLENFEKYFGYQGDIYLAKWLLIDHLIKIGEFENPYTGYPFFKDNFEKVLLNTNATWKHLVTNHFFPEFCGIFMPLVSIGGDGIGGSYHTCFCSSDDDTNIYFSDHDEYPSYLQNVFSIQDFFRMQSNENLEAAINFIISEKSKSLGLGIVNYKLDFDADYLNEKVVPFMQLVEETKPLESLFKKSTSILGTNEDKKLSALLTNKESDYYKYDNVRAHYNPLVAANLYWYYLTGQFDALLQLLEESKNIQGSFYQSIRTTFVEFSQGDLTKLNFKFGELNHLRKGLEISPSKFIDFEYEKFATEIEAFEKKKALELEKKSTHQNDNFFRLNVRISNPGWGYEETSENLNKEAVENKKEENSPTFAVLTRNILDPLKVPSELPDRVFRAESSYIGSSLIVSEKLKLFLEQYKLPRHKFHPIHVNHDNQIHHYYKYVQSSDVDDMSRLIDFSKTSFEKLVKISIYNEKRIIEQTTNRIINENIKFENYEAFINIATGSNPDNYKVEKVNGGRMVTQSTYQYKNGELYLKEVFDLFHFYELYLSNRLKSALEKNNFNLYNSTFSYLSSNKTFGRFTKIINPLSNEHNSN